MPAALSLAPMVRLRAPVAQYFNFSTEHLFRVLPTDFVFPGEFALVVRRGRLRFGRVTAAGLEISTGEILTGCEIVARAAPLEAYHGET